MKTSVIMATYNGEKFIIEQLDSLRTQTMIPNEVIICDDCSIDNTVILIEQYIKKYNLKNSWKLIVNEQNLGYADNFCKATALAEGDYIFFADQDDIWEKTKIEIMLKIMEQKDDCQLLSTDYGIFGLNIDKMNIPKKTLELMPNNGVLEKIYFDKTSFYIGALGCCMCLRKTFYKEISDYWFDGWAQDDRMWRMSQCVDGCYLLHSNLTLHRLHDSNTATYGKYHSSESRVRLFKNMQKANIEMMKFFSDNFADDNKQEIVKKHIAMMNLRIELLEQHKVINSIPLLKYIKYYQTKKSFFLECYMALLRK